MKNLIALLALTALGVSACEMESPTPPDPAFSFGASGSTYLVTIENLTSGQPITPPLVATHRASTRLFQVGAVASLGVREIAENGNLDPMVASLGGNKHVSNSAILFGASAPPVFPGETVSMEIDATLGATRLSWLSMLICTNDGFTGSDGVALPTELGQSAMYYTSGYDAGSEINTEAFADIVPPCGPMTGVDSGGQGTGASNPALAEGGVIHHHPGILGGAGLLTAVHGWSNPVARLTITRVR